MQRPQVRTSELFTIGPLNSAAEYTPKRLEERANYANARLNSSVPTPITAKVLTLYKNACMLLHLDYDNFSRDEVLKRAEEIRGYDEDFSHKTWLREDPESSRVENILELRRHTYWARYGLES